MQPRFTYNNKPHFPTSHTTSWNYTFKIDLGNLYQFLSIITRNDVVAVHGKLRCVANVTRELCKGIMRAFEKLMRDLGENEPMWLDSC